MRRTSGAVQDIWSEFLIDADRLSEWLSRIPGWMDPVPPAHRSAGRLLGALAKTTHANTQLDAHLARLWTAGEIERTARGRVLVVEDRIRLDTVTLLIQDIESGRLAGLHIRTNVVSSRRIHFEIKRRGFFIDPMLYVLLVLLDSSGQVGKFCLLIPSAAVPALGYSETMTLEPLTKCFRDYQIPSEIFASTFLARVFEDAALRAA